MYKCLNDIFVGEGKEPHQRIFHSNISDKFLTPRGALLQFLRFNVLITKAFYYRHSIEIHCGHPGMQEH